MPASARSVRPLASAISMRPAGGDGGASRRRRWWWCASHAHRHHPRRRRGGRRLPRDGRRTGRGCNRRIDAGLADPADADTVVAQLSAPQMDRRRRHAMAGRNSIEPAGAAERLRHDRHPLGVRPPPRLFGANPILSVHPRLRVARTRLSIPGSRASDNPAHPQFRADAYVWSARVVPTARFQRDA